LLRSPTAAVVLSQEPYNYNTRAVGVDHDHALIPVDNVMLEWADEIVCMEKYHEQMIRMLFPDYDKEITVLDIPDRFRYRDPELIEMIKEKYDGQPKDLKMKIESSGEVTMWDNAFKKKAEQMSDTIAKEYDKNVLP